MKTIYLIRHGKSSWENMSLQDYERPLLEKGIRRTRKVAKYLKEKSISPQLIVSSHAVRAFETAKILAKKLEYSAGNILIDENLYFAGGEAIENILFGLDNSIDEVMLIGHNPDITNFANTFLVEKIDYMPTSAVVCVRFNTNDWSQIMMVEREIPLIITPKSL